MFSYLSNQLPLALRSPRVLIAAGIGFATAAGIASYVLTRRKPTPEEIERERRDLLSRTGRITDGTIMETLAEPVTEPRMELPDSYETPELPEAVPEPHIIIYKYRIGGVTYECAQDVTMLADHVHGIRTDLPIQVRYEPHNPGNSIVVAESWSGLRLISTEPHSGH